MLKHADIANEYRLNTHGSHIGSPGKFVGDPWWVPSLWDATMDGLDDRTTGDGETDDIVSWFQVTAAMCDGSDCDMPRDLLGKWIGLWEDGNGFVRHVLQDNAPDF